MGRNPAELIRQIKAYQHHQKTGEVMPSGWTEGGQTLKPSTELAGTSGRCGSPTSKREVLCIYDADGGGPFRDGRPPFRFGCRRRGGI